MVTKSVGTRATTATRPGCVSRGLCGKTPLGCRKKHQARQKKHQAFSENV